MALRDFVATVLKDLELKRTTMGEGGVKTNKKVRDVIYR